MAAIPILAAALWYATLGFGVFPCQPGSKLPATRRGFKDGSTSPNVIKGVFRSGNNIGLIAPADVLILDFDVSKDEARRLAERRDEARYLRMELERSYSEVARAPVHKTPSHGFHVFLRLPETAPHLATGKWPRGAQVSHGDLRGMNRAYVVAPPSSTNEGAYSVVRSLVAVEDLPEASAALLQYLSPTPVPKQPIGRPSPAQRARTLAALTDKVRSAPEGTRNVTLNRNAFLAGIQVAAGHVDTSVAERQLLVAAIDAGLTMSEALATIRSGMSARELKGRHV